MIHLWMLYSAGVALLLGVAAHLLEGAVRQRNWPIRGLWIGAVAGSLLLPALALLIPAGSSASAPAAVRYVEAPAPQTATVDPTLPPAAVTGSRPVAASRGSLDLDPWLVGAWGIASLFMLCGVTASGILLWSRSRGWAHSRLDGRDVWISGETGPAVVGFIRSRIVVPEWVLAQEEDERGMILTHEEEHLRAGDPYLLLGALLLLIALPWNAALWWQSRRLREAVEVDCDRRVLARGVDARRYSRLLLEVSAHGTANRLMVTALSESPSGLERRIRRMLARTPKRWRHRLAAAAAPALLLVAVACEIPRPTMPAPQSSLEAAVGQRLVQVDRPNPDDIAKGIMLEHFPEEYARAGEGDTLHLWFIARADGDIERVALTEPILDSMGGPQLLRRIFPGESGDNMYRNGAGTYFTHSGQGRSAAWPGGPEFLLVNWWQRQSSPGVSLDPHFMQSPEALSRQATIEALFPDLVEKGIEDGSALWVAFDDSLSLYHAWIGPDFDAHRSDLSLAAAESQRSAVWDQVKGHLAEVLPDYEHRGISRRGFTTRDGGRASLVWVEQAPAAIELRWQ